jgi:hypothetical protein
MFRILVGLLYLVEVTSAQNTYNFVEASRLVSGVGYGFVMIDIGLNELGTRAEAITELQQQLWIAHQQQGGVMLTVYLKLLNYKIIHAISRYRNVCRLVSHPGMKAPTTKKYQQQTATKMTPTQNVPESNTTTNGINIGRKKWQVMLLMGAFMLGMECLNTLVLQSRISALSGQVEDIRDRQDNIIALVTREETQIKNNHENLEIVRRVIEMKEEEDKWYNLGAAVNIVVEEFLNDIELTEELLGAALDKKLHPRLINETIAKEKLLEVSKYATCKY